MFAARCAPLWCRCRSCVFNLALDPKRGGKRRKEKRGEGKSTSALAIMDRCGSPVNFSATGGGNRRRLARPAAPKHIKLTQESWSGACTPSPPRPLSNSMRGGGPPPLATCGGERTRSRHDPHVTHFQHAVGMMLRQLPHPGHDNRGLAGSGGGGLHDARRCARGGGGRTHPVSTLNTSANEERAQLGATRALCTRRPRVASGRHLRSPPARRALS